MGVEVGEEKARVGADWANPGVVLVGMLPSTSRVLSFDGEAEEGRQKVQRNLFLLFVPASHFFMRLNASQSLDRYESDPTATHRAHSRHASLTRPAEQKRQQTQKGCVIGENG